MADCVNNKVDSNTTGLAFAEEVCARQLPTVANDGHAPIWYELEPNSYGDFGGDLKTKARKPINRNRRNKKGTPIDLDAKAEFVMDFTQHNHNRLLQGFFFSDMREKITTLPINGDPIVITGVVASSDRYTAAAGLGIFQVGDLVFVSGSDNGDNNGLQTVDEVADGYVGVAGSLVDETPSGTIIITKVGHQFDASGASIALAGSLGVLTLAASPVAATGVLTLTGLPVADDTVTIGDAIYIFKAAPVDAYEVLIGTDEIDTAENLRKAINGDLLGTPAHTLVSAVDGGAGEITITALVKGTVGNGIVTTESATNTSWLAGVTSGGTGYSLHSLFGVVGEWCFVGGDATGTAFANNLGYARIGSLTDTTATFDKTTWTPTAEGAGSFAIEVFVGSALRDEDADLAVTRYVQFERTLGEDANGTQAEYVRGAVGDEFKLNIPLANDITGDLKFMAADTTDRTGLEGLKDGTRFGAAGEDAFNTSSDIVRMHMSIVDATTSVPTPLFAYVTEASFLLKNNASAVKAVSALGGIDVNVGNFDVSGAATALFTNIDAIRAIRQNKSVTLDFIAAKLNHGFIWDIPLLTLNGGRPKISENEPVTLPLNIFGAENPNSYTALYQTFDYLPTVAMPTVAD